VEEVEWFRKYDHPRSLSNTTDAGARCRKENVPRDDRHDVFPDVASSTSSQPRERDCLLRNLDVSMTKTVAAAADDDDDDEDDDCDDDAAANDVDRRHHEETDYGATRYWNVSTMHTALLDRKSVV